MKETKLRIKEGPFMESKNTIWWYKKEKVNSQIESSKTNIRTYHEFNRCMNYFKGRGR